LYVAAVGQRIEELNEMVREERHRAHVSLEYEVAITGSQT
jgi:hypothetical protein